MRKLLSVGLLVLIGCMCSSQELLIPVPGDYVFYKSESKVLGILYFNPQLFRVRLLNNYNENTIIDVTHSGGNNGYVIQSIKVLNGLLTPEEQKGFINEFQFLLSNRAKIKDSEFIKQPSLNYTINTSKNVYNMKFEYWIPCIQLKSFSNNKDEMMYNLIKVGRLESQDDNSFYNYKEIKFDIKNIATKLAVFELYQNEHDNISYSIYKNWTKTTDSTSSDMYILSEITKQDAVLLIENVDLGKNDIQDPLFFIKYYILLSNPHIIPDSIQIINSEIITLSFETYNEQTKYITKHMNRIFEYSDGKYNVITLAVYKDLYDNNEAYFDAIWSSIRKS